MIEKLQVENYRSFPAYAVNGVKRVNLLTGRNNSGKTSLLEAVLFLNSDGDPSILADIAIRRGELIATEFTRVPGRIDSMVDVAHFFHGHQLSPEAMFSVSAGDVRKQVIVRIANQSDFERQLPMIDIDDDPSNYAIAIERPLTNRSKSPIPIPLTADGGFRLYDARRYQRTAFQQDSTTPLQLITPDSLDASEMGRLWNAVIRERKEEKVNESLRILDETIEDVQFLNDEERSVRSGRGGIVLGSNRHHRRMPLGSYGEGMRRLLALSISLATVSNGILLIDEIDTGLHHSVLADMWKLVIATAIKNDIQVFATTHSLDCLRGLHEACERNPEFASEISLQTIDRNLDVSIAGDADDLRSAMDMGIEVR